MKVGLVTVTYNSGPVIDEFLASVRAQTHRDFLIYLIDNNSSDNVVAHIRRAADPRHRLILNAENLGVAAGNNQGIRAAIAEGCSHVLLINNDTVFGPELIGSLLETLDRVQADMVTPKITYFMPENRIWCAGGRFQKWLGDTPLHLGLNAIDDGRFDTPLWIDYAPTCCVLARKSVFDRAGLMDETYFVYWDDVDFMYRARKAGLRLYYTPQPILRHKVSMLTGGGQSDFTIRYETRNLVYFTRKHFRASAPFWLLFHAARFTARVVLRRDSWNVLRKRYPAIREGLKLQLPASDEEL